MHKQHRKVRGDHSRPPHAKSPWSSNMHHQKQTKNNCGPDWEGLCSTWVGFATIYVMYAESWKAFLRFHSTTHRPLQKRRSRYPGEGHSKGDPIPSDVFNQVIKTPFVRHWDLQVISISMICQEDWKAQIISYLWGHYHPVDLSEESRLAYRCR